MRPALPRPADWVGPAALVGATAVALWLLFDVTVGAIVRFAGFELGFTLVPGVAVFLALDGARRVGLREIALGWALGYALEIGAFALTAALGERDLLWAYPPLVVLAAGAALALRGRRGAEADARAEAQAAEAAADASGPPEGGAWRWGLAGVIVVLLVYLAEGYFAANPLPDHLHQAISYDQDLVWQISIAAEVLHHWPPVLPNIVDVPLHYHYFSSLNLAATSQVTHLGLPVVNLRLWVVPVVVLAALQVFTLGRALDRRAWTGVVAVALAFLVGGFDPWPRPPSEFFTHIYLSDSFGLGLIFFLALAILLAEVLGPARANSAGRWAMIVGFGAAASGAKSTVLAVVVLALGVFGAGTLWVQRRVPWRERRVLFGVVLAGLLLGIVALVARSVIYPGTSGELSVRPFHVVTELHPARLFDKELHVTGVLKTVVVALSAVLVVLKLMAPLLVGLWVAVRAPVGHTVAAAWCLALLGTGLITYLMLTHPRDSELYFLYYGYIAGAALAAAGLRLLWERYVTVPRISPAWAAVVAVLVGLVWATDAPPGGREGEPTPPRFYRALMGEVTWSQANDNATPGLLAGMNWLRTRTPTDAVLAVSNRWQDPGAADARWCYASAFAERRVMLECEYGRFHANALAPLSELRRDPGAGPYGERARLNQGIFFDGDRRAAREAARRYGVSYAVLDLVHLHDAPPEAVERLGRVVFRNEGIVVVRLRDAPA